MAGKIYVAKTSGVVRYGDGQEAHIQQGVTRVREGHPLLKGREQLFEELSVQYDVETTRQAPKAEAKPAPKAEAKASPAEASGSASEAKAAPATKADEEYAGAAAKKAPATRPQRGPRKPS